MTTHTPAPHTMDVLALDVIASQVGPYRADMDEQAHRADLTHDFETYRSFFGPVVAAHLLTVGLSAMRASLVEKHDLHAAKVRAIRRWGLT